MNEATATARPTLLSDTPADIDRFEAHTRTAEGVAALIEHGEGGKTIAIEGGWGAGKSSVVRQLASHFKGTDVYVHVYDAWVHAGDPLRRAFLTSLVQALRERGWLADVNTEAGKQLNLEMDKVARRYKETQQRTIPLLTSFGRILFASLLFTPLGAALFSYSLPTAAWTELTLGVLLTLMPIWLMMLRWGWAKCRKETLPDDILPLILMRSSISNTLQISETPDPTSVEFQDLFSRVLGEALGLSSSKNQKLVLVVDNLDRLSSNEVSQVWAMLRSFVDNSGFSRLPWVSRLWIIIPVAPARPDSARVEGDAALASDMSADFLEKVFQARFILPPPVLKNWRTELRRLLEQAFPSEYLEETEKVLDVFELTGRGGDLSVTPRALVLFVNQLVTLALQWGLRFPLPILAAYTLETSNKDVIRALQSGEIPGELVRQRLATNLTAQYAAIFFNLGEEGKALELVQSPVAQELLSKGDHAELVKQVRADESFAHTVNGLLIRDSLTWAKTEQERLFKAVLAILGPDAPNDEDERTGTDAQDVGALRRVVKKLLELMPARLRQFSSIPMGAPSCATALCALLDYSDSEGIAGEVVRLLCALPTDNASGRADVFSPPSASNLDAWIVGLSRVARHPRIAVCLRSDRRVSVPLGPDLFGRALVVCREDGDEEALARYAPKGETGTVAAHLTQRATEGEWESNEVMLVDWLNARGEVQLFDQIAPALEQRLSASTALSVGFAAAIAEVLVRFAKPVPKLGKLRERSVSIGWIHHHLQVHLQSIDLAPGLLALVALLERPDGTAGTQWNQSAQGQATIQQLLSSPTSQPKLEKTILEAIKQTNSVSQWYGVSLNSGAIALLTSRFLEDSEFKSDFLACIPMQRIVGDVRTLVDFSGRPVQSTDFFARDAFAYCSGLSGFAGALSAQVTSTDDAWAAALALEFALSEEEELLGALAERVCSSASEAEWDAHLASGGALIGILKSLDARGRSVRLQGPLRNSLLRKLKATVEGEAIAPDTKDSWQALFRALESHAKQGLADDVFEFVVALDRDATQEFWSLAGELLGESAKRRGRMEGAGRRLFLPLAERGDLYGLRWLTNCIKDAGNVYQLTGDSVALQDLAQSAYDRLKGGEVSGEMKETLELLIDLLATSQPPVEPTRESTQASEDNREVES